MPKPREVIDRARERVAPAVQVVERFRYDPPAVGWKQTAVLFLIMCFVAGVLFYAGKRVERSWWRAQIAAKSAAANQILTQLGTEAPDLDERMIREFSNEIAQLRSAERRLADATREAERTRERLREVEMARQAGVNVPPPPVDVCRPLPAHCLR